MRQKDELYLRFLTIFNQHFGDYNGKKLLLTISGGLDSMVLLHLVKRTGILFSVAHCNFQLRGDASDLDEKLVAENANSEIFISKFETQDYAKSRKVSIEMAARELRYTWFDELCKKHNFTHVLTAHHAGDHFETALLNLTKGTGINGLKGIPEFRGNIYRPLLSFSKNELLDYAKNHSIIWREDKSNESNEYQRNKLRNEVIPILKEINPNLEHTFGNASWRLQQIADLVENQKETLGKKYFINKEWNFPASLLKERTEKALLIEFFIEYGFEVAVLRKFLFEDNWKIGSRIWSNNNELEILKDRNAFILHYKEELRSFNTSIREDSTSIDTPLGVLTIRKRIDFPTMEEFQNLSNLFIDPSTLTFPLVLRLWENGDKMRPFGMKGHKLISDILIDKKVPLSQKGKQLVLVNNNEILWLLGLKASEFSKLKHSDSELLHLQLEK